MSIKKEIQIRKQVAFINACRRTRNSVRKKNGLEPVPMLTKKEYKSKIARSVFKDQS